MGTGWVLAVLAWVVAVGVVVQVLLFWRVVRIVLRRQAAQEIRIEGFEKRATDVERIVLTPPPWRRMGPPR